MDGMMFSEEREMGMRCGDEFRGVEEVGEVEKWKKDLWDWASW